MNRVIKTRIFPFTIAEKKKSRAIFSFKGESSAFHLFDWAILLTNTFISFAREHSFLPVSCLWSPVHNARQIARR